MRKITIFIFVTVILAACSMQIAPQPVQPTPTLTTIIQLTPTPIATQVAVTLPPPASSLALCANAGTASACTEPSAQELDRFCSAKTPYTLYTLPIGSTVEVITKGFTCHDEGVRNGKQMYSCTGTPQFYFNVKVCSPGCALNLQPSDQCAQGYGLDSKNNCCSPIPTVNGCVEMRWAIGACG